MLPNSYLASARLLVSSCCQRLTGTNITQGPYIQSSLIANRSLVTLSVFSKTNLISNSRNLQKQQDLLIPSLAQLQISRGKHNVIRDKKKGYNWFRERPFGPQRPAAPHIVGRINSNNYRRIVHYPEDGKYTIKKLNITKLGGRDPVTGRKVINRVGGGHKQKYRWIDWKRIPDDWPRDGTVLEERINNICYDPCRKAMIAMTGDLIRSYTTIPNNPIRPKEGDSHPLGALPIGTTVCLVESWPGEGATFATEAEENCKVMRKVGDRVVVKVKDRLEYNIPQEAQCVIGTVSIHPLKALPIGSPNRMRWLGIAPSSGLFQKKTGRFGRKIKKLPPPQDTVPKEEEFRYRGTPTYKAVKGRSLYLTASTEGRRGRRRASKRMIENGRVLKGDVW